MQGLPSIDILPRWGGIHAAVKIGVERGRGSIVSFAPEERNVYRTPMQPRLALQMSFKKLNG